jgi:hypothetical protein
VTKGPARNLGPLQRRFGSGTGISVVGIGNGNLCARSKRCRQWPWLLHVEIEGDRFCKGTKIDPRIWCLRYGADWVACGGSVGCGRPISSAGLSHVFSGSNCYARWFTCFLQFDIQKLRSGFIYTKLIDGYLSLGFSQSTRNISSFLNSSSL